MVPATAFSTAVEVKKPITKTVSLDLVSQTESTSPTPGHMAIPRPHPDLSTIKRDVVTIPDVTVSSMSGIVVDMLEQVDESVILGYLEELVGFGPRVTGTPACVAAAGWIYNEFQNMGLSVRYHNWSNGGYTSKNVEATIYGMESEDEIYIICGHYDTVSGSPGADDDGSGVVAVMTAAYIMSQYVFNYTIRFVTFSGEEQGLLGSEVYAQQAAAQGENIVGVLNADMIGFALSAYDGSNLKVYEDTASEWLYTFTNNVKNQYNDYIHLNLLHSGYTWGSDHNSFWDYGYCALFYHEYNFNDYYHSPEDTIENMNITYATKVTRIMLATLAELAHPSYPSNPPAVPTITGPINGVINQEYTYTVVTTDPDDDDVYYYIDWGDGTNSGWLGPYTSGAPIQSSHTWLGLGSYQVRVKAKDINAAQSTWSEPLVVTIFGNAPPNKPTIDGPTNGKIGVTYQYNITATDPDGDQVYLFVSWGDNTNTGWIGPYSSGEVVIVSHKWNRKGTYTISAKARDIWGYESSWATLTVVMPRDQSISQQTSQQNNQLLQMMTKTIKQISNR
ncbi:MAG: M28 family peptidase [Candidatus Thermoplasmatota archaeon]|nr:M28 family peptidase [Candidatus Thermoplasmatota archaeon]